MATPFQVLSPRQTAPYKLLQADDIGTSGGEPGEEVGKPLVDVVDVEGGDLQGISPRALVDGT
jgi:hypothetical protein